AIELGMSGVRRRIDLGQVGRRTFAVASGIGFDAQMLAAAPQGTKRLLGWPAYLLAAVRHVPGPGFEVSMELDGQRLPPRRVRAVLVANVGRLPGGIRLLPEALPDDGLLDVALIAPSRLRDWGQLVGHVLTGSPLRQGLEVFQARQVLVSTDASQLWEIDGEPVGQTQTLRATVRPGALWVCVPPAD
ncbi:MAG: diacylglycerol/lipid kinase family protein, partial [Candidatus Dormibacteria bacterium]